MSDSFVTLWTIGHQAPLSMRFPRQEWSRLLFSSGDLPNPEIKTTFPASTGRFFTNESPGKPFVASISWSNSKNHVKTSVKNLTIYVFLGVLSFQVLYSRL